MKRSLLRGSVLALAGSVVAALAVATPATALPLPGTGPLLGTATGSPLTGSVLNQARVITSAPCPTGTGAIDLFIDNAAAGFSAVVVTGADPTAVAGINTTGVLFGNSLANVAANEGKILINGTYDLTVNCSDGLGGSTGHFDASLVISGGATPTAQGTTFTFNVPALPTTSTVLTVSPAGPVTLGASVTLTATVSATGVTPAGSVQFKSGTTNVGAAVPVGAGGVATLTTNALPPGANQALTAVFTPAAPATTQGSTSNTVTFTVNAPAQATTLTLASSPAAPTTADVVTVTANVSSTTAVNVGRVTFTETTAATPTPQIANVVAGVATISVVGLSAGSHTFSAAYADNGTPQQFLPSGPVTITITVVAFTGASDTENITTTVAAGTITLTAGGTVNLGTLALNAANTLLTAGPVAMNNVTVTDTRAGNLGYTVSGQVTDFSGPGTSKINGENLGWAPKLISTSSPTGISAGPVVAPGNGVAVGATTGAGLKTSRILAQAAAGSGLGTSIYSADLTLQAPTTTTAGVYNATLTLTAL